MKKIIAKILYAILALVILVCVFIGLCAANPGLTKPLNSIAKKIEAQNKAKAEAKAKEEAEKAAQESAKAASTEESVPEETKEEEEPEPEDDVSAEGPET